MMLADLNPHLLAQELVKISGEYSTMSEEAAQIEMRRPFKWSELRASLNTDKAADNDYAKTEDGQRWIYLRTIMKASEKRQSAIKNMLRVCENEARNLH